LLAAIGGLSIGVGILVVFIGIRRAGDRRLNVLFGAFALAYGGWTFAARAGYFATDVAGQQAAGRVTSAFAASSFLLLVLYVAEYSEVRPRLLIYPFVGLFAAIAGASLAAPDELLTNSPVGMALVTLPWGETVRVLQVSDSTFLMLWLFAEAAVVAYIAWAIVVMARREGWRSAGLLAIGTGWFLAMIVADFFVVVGAYEFIWFSSLGFLAFTISMSLEVADRAIRTEQELLLLQAGLEAEIAERTAHLEAVQQELVAKTAEEAAIAERDRLARELHDAVTQTLFSLNIIAGSLGRLWRTDPEAAERSTDEVRRFARGALAEMRVLLRELRPHSIAETGLDTLVSQLSDGLGARYGIPAKVHTSVDCSLPDNVHLAFYRVAQEAMQNVGKHADASRLTIDLTGDNGEVRLAVEDDGVGFDTVDKTEGGMGLRIMQERADTIGAALALTSSPGAGTSIELTWTPPEESHPV
jgi:signal transduction histidine kinase